MYSTCALLHDLGAPCIIWSAIVGLSRNEKKEYSGNVLKITQIPLLLHCALHPPPPLRSSSGAPTVHASLSLLCSSDDITYIYMMAATNQGLRLAAAVT